LEENFGVGANTTTPGIAAAYCYNLDVVPSTCPNTALTLEEAIRYNAIIPNNPAWFVLGITRMGLILMPAFSGYWWAAGANGVLYSKVINDVYT
jgi:hypothetical protein